MSKDLKAKALKMYIESDRKMSLKDIASSLGVSDGTVRSWKNRYKWDDPEPVATNASKDKKKNATLQNKKRNTTLKMQRNVKGIEKTKPEFEIEIENDDLNDRQRMFCIYYVKSFNATQSAIKAGYAKDSAHVEGSRLLANAKIKAELQRIKASMANSLMIDAMDVLNKYAAIAFADISDYVEFGQEEIPLFTKKGAPILKEDGTQLTAKETFVAFRNADEVDASIISEVKTGKETSIKLHDKMKALEMLTKYFDILPDHHKRRIEEEKLKIDQERLELDKAKAAGKDGGDDDLVDDWAEAVMDDGSDEREEVEA